MSDLVLLTGISGFIAKHVALELLRQGYRVRGTVRQTTAADAVTETLRAAGADTTGLSFIEADLTKHDGWREAAEGCRYVQHLASPFPLKQPKDRDGLIPMAVGGTARVLKAALDAGVERAVLTSSIVSMMYRAGRAGELPLKESDWTDTDWAGANAYAISKTRAEQEAWRIMRAAGAETRLAVVNPGLVLGPLLDRDFGTSVNVIKLMLDGKYPAVPPINFPVVDVRDLARIHVRAMVVAEAGGRRLLSAGGTLSMPQMGRILREALGHRARRVPKITLPPLAMKFAALFDPAVRTILPDLGVRPVADSRYVTEMTGIAFREGRDAVIATGQSLIDLGLAKT